MTILQIVIVQPVILQFVILLHVIVILEHVILQRVDLRRDIHAGTAHLMRLSVLCGEALTVAANEDDVPMLCQLMLVRGRG